MSVTHPSPFKVRALERRWEGEEHRLQAIARDLRAGRDWTVHLRGLPFVQEVPPHEGEALGRDLRGADLRQWLHPEMDVRLAQETEAPLVAAISLEALRNNTPLPDVSPFPVEVEGAGEIALAIRRGERFFLARSDGDPVGVVRCVRRQEFCDHTGREPYLEISGLAVLWRWRRHGIGARLIEEAERLAVEDGVAFTLLRTTREIGLVPWYEAHGYETKLVRQLAYPDAPTCLDVVLAKKMRARATVQPPLWGVAVRGGERAPGPGAGGPGF